MCIKIIGPEKEQEFDPSSPIEEQISDAKEIRVKYEVSETRKINSFVNEIERMIRSGISCQADIRVDWNNDLDGLRLERKLEKLKLKLDVNEVVKGLCHFHADADGKLKEISEMCLGKINE